MICPKKEDEAEKTKILKSVRDGFGAKPKEKEASEAEAVEDSEEIKDTKTSRSALEKLGCRSRFVQAKAKEEKQATAAPT